MLAAVAAGSSGPSRSRSNGDFNISFFRNLHSRDGLQWDVASMSDIIFYIGFSKPGCNREKAEINSDLFEFWG